MKNVMRLDVGPRSKFYEAAKLAKARGYVIQVKSGKGRMVSTITASNGGIVITPHTAYMSSGKLLRVIRGE